MSALKRKIQTLHPPILLDHLPIGYQVLILYQLFQAPDLITRLRLCNHWICPPPPSIAPYAPAGTLSQSHQSVPSSPADNGNSSSANARHVRGPSSAHTSPKDVQPAVSAPYHDTHNCPAHIQRAPSAAPTPHVTPLLTPQITRSSSIILGIHPLAMTNNIHHRPTGLMSASH